MYNARYLLLIVYVTENSFLFFEYIKNQVPVHVPVYIVHARVIECTFLSEKNNYSPEASGGLHAIWNTLLNFKKNGV